MCYKTVKINKLQTYFFLQLIFVGFILYVIASVSQRTKCIKNPTTLRTTGAYTAHLGSGKVLETNLLPQFP